ncbi:hypothetical protein DFH28DRAFT_939579 [Melampsora americana]|nr:hypothetical protein DFH28DRAFT_939579 [Melampsora americana]
MPRDRDPTWARSYCTDGHDTWSYPNEDCKPSLHVNQPPAASKCTSKMYPNIKTGWCPTYRPHTRNEKNEVILYFCEILIKQGATIDVKDKYWIMPCGSLTNKITCNGPRGRFEGTTVPYMSA